MTLFSTIKRLTALCRRKQRARQLGFRFKRTAGFVVPSEVDIGSKHIQLRLPDDNGTRIAFIDVLLDDCYRLNELPEDVHKIVDIGCHVGLFSIAARRRWPQAVIHAYEPNAELKSFCDHHKIQADFSLFLEAVGFQSGSAVLIPNADSVQVRTVQTDNGIIKQVAFQEVLARFGGYADLVKLDCEGAEWSILRDEESWKRVRFLTMEFHTWAGYSLDELRACLVKLGFQVTRLHVTGPDFGLLLANRK